MKVGGSFQVGMQSSGSQSRGPSIRFMPGDYSDDAGGAAVATVTKGGPADKAGIKDGDVIVEVDGVPVKNMVAYTAEMRKKKAGQRRRDDSSAESGADQGEGDAGVNE